MSHPQQPSQVTVTAPRDAGVPAVPLVVASCVALPVLGLFTLLALGDLYVITHLRVVDLPGGSALDRPSALDVVTREAWRFALLIAGWLGLVVTWVAAFKNRRRLTWTGATVACGVSLGLVLLAAAAT